MTKTIKRIFSRKNQASPDSRLGKYSIVDKGQIDSKGFWRVSSEDIAGSRDYKTQEKAYNEMINTRQAS